MFISRISKISFSRVRLSVFIDEIVIMKGFRVVYLIFVVVVLLGIIIIEILVCFFLLFRLGILEVISLWMCGMIIFLFSGV